MTLLNNKKKLLNYKETLFFIAKSLTISIEEKNKDEIEFVLKKSDVDWELVVKISTAHYVLPTIYCNYKRSNFLKYLPSDLINYMKHITDLNRDRNKQILQQAKDLNNVLLKNGVRPIFLKGTGNLLAGLYDDIGERMVGDIDFLFCEKDFFKAIDIIKNDKYLKSEEQLDNFPGFRHHPRLHKPENIAAVEIHKDVTIEKYRDEFNFKIISEDAQLINDFLVMSYENKLSLSIISNQINDYAFELGIFSLRPAYDVYLLSKKTNTQKVISNFNKLMVPLNCFVSNCNFIFGDLESLKHFETKDSKNYLKEFKFSLNRKKSNPKINIMLFAINLKRRLVIFCKSIFNSENRKWLFQRIKRKIRIKN